MKQQKIKKNQRNQKLFKMFEKMNKIDKPLDQSVEITYQKQKKERLDTTIPSIDKRRLIREQH